MHSRADSPKPNSASADQSSALDLLTALADSGMTGSESRRQDSRRSQIIRQVGSSRPNLVVPMLGSDSQKQSYTKLGRQRRSAQYGQS
jgi:hypothetical protein